MDVATITVLSTIAIGILTPIDWYVALTFYRAWRGGEHIPYFAPTLALIVTVAATVTACLFVGLSAIALRFTGQGIVPPGVGLLIVACALLLPSAALLWMWRLLRQRHP
jgi:hypothetical protein